MCSLKLELRMPRFFQAELRAVLTLILFLFAGVFLGAAPAWAGETRAVSLEECIRLAFKSNTDLRKDRLDRKLSLLDRRIGESHFYPDLYLRPETDYRTDEDGRARLRLEAEVVQRIPTGGKLSVSVREGYNRYTSYGEDDWTSKVSIKFSQPLLRGAGLRVGTAPVVLSRLDDDYDLNGYCWLITRRITQVEKRYWALARADQNLALAQKFLNDTEEISREIARRTGSGEDPEWEAEIAGRKLDISNAQLTRTRANLALLDLLDLDGVDEIRTVTRLWRRPKDEVRGLKENLEVALRQRPDLKQAAILVDSTGLRSDVAGSNALQDIDLAVEAATLATEDELGDSIHDALNLDNEFIFSLGAEIRFGVPGRKRIATAARYRHLKAKLDFSERKQSVRNDVVTALDSLKNSRYSFSQALEVERLAKIKLDSVLKKLDERGADNLKMIIYQRDLNRAQSRVYRAALEYLYDLADLTEATGSTVSKWGIEIVLKADD